MRAYDKKEIERHRMRQFAAVCSDFPVGDLVSGESPDFVISGMVGFELTELHREPPTDGGQSIQASDSQRRQIVDGAKSLFESAGGHPLDVTVYFTNSEWIGKRRISRLASEIASLVQEHDVAQDSWAEIKDGEDYDSVNLPAEISRVLIRRRSGRRHGIWYTAGLIFVEDLSPAAIQSRIDEKNELLPAYRMTASEQWLIILIGMWSSSTFDIPSILLGHKFDSGFDRVYLFDVFGQFALRLNTQ